MLRRRSLLRRVPRVGSPASSLLLRRSDFSCPGSLGSPPRSPFRPLPPEVTRSPRFLGNPCARAACQRPRWGGGVRTPGDHAPALRLRRCCLPRSPPCRPHDVPISGLAHAAHAPAVYASQPPSRTVHARLAPGGGPRPYRYGTLTRGSLREVSVRYMTSSSPRLRLAQGTRGLGPGARGLRLRVGPRAASPDPRAPHALAAASHYPRAASHDQMDRDRLRGWRERGRLDGGDLF